MRNQDIHPLPVREICKNHLPNELFTPFKEIVEAFIQSVVYKVLVGERNTIRPLRNILERTSSTRHQGIQGIRGYGQEIATIDSIPGNHFSGLPTALGNILRRFLGTDKVRRSIIEGGVTTGKFLSGIKPLLDFFPEAEVEELEAVKLDVRGKSQGQVASLFQYNYPIFIDDFMFRVNPGGFGSMRENYSYRREFFID